MRTGILLFIAGTMLLPAGLRASMAAPNPLPVGKTSIVVNQVIGNNQERSRQLSVDDPVFALDLISADANSHGELLLNDNSHILVGPGAEISLDDFVVTQGGIQSATLNVLKGAFRFVSGDSAKGTFKIKTPLATIGIRGTLFDIYVGENGQTDVILYSGRVRVCTLTNRCRVMTRSCDIIRIASKRRIGFRRFLRSRNNAAENNEYNLVDDQERFQKNWRAPISACSLRAQQRNIDKRGESDTDGTFGGRGEEGGRGGKGGKD